MSEVEDWLRCDGEDWRDRFCGILLSRDGL